MSPTAAIFENVRVGVDADRLTSMRPRAITEAQKA
jgi:hypothetical protein